MIKRQDIISKLYISTQSQKAVSDYFTSKHILLALHGRIVCYLAYQPPGLSVNFFIHLKLELQTQLPASNDKKNIPIYEISPMINYLTNSASTINYLIKPVLVYCWASICNAGPTLNQHWFIIVTFHVVQNWFEAIYIQA